MSFKSTSHESQSLLLHHHHHHLPPPTLDLYWILAGLWSAVFLGALDGTYLSLILLSGYYISLL